jgi:UDP-N-acetylmuramoylalanine--D-glutamate ligase
VWSVQPAPDDVLVVEVSSYQAVDVHTRPDIGVLTSLSSDHLSWHGGQQQYERDKLSLFGQPGEVGVLLVAAREPGALAATEHLHPQLVDVEDDTFATLRTAAAERDLGGPVVANLALACAAAAAVVGAPLSDDVVRAGVGAFEPLQSRHQTVVVRDGIRYIDDALATNPSAAAVSLAPYADLPVALIIGGEDRAVALDPLQEAIAAHRAPLVLITVPDTGPAMAAELVHVAPAGASISVVATGDVGEAVRVATEALRSHGNGVVLFAPGAPTPGHLGTWKDRSAHFHAAAQPA